MQMGGLWETGRAESRRLLAMWQTPLSHAPSRAVARIPKARGLWHSQGSAIAAAHACHFSKIGNPTLLADICRMLQRVQGSAVLVFLGRIDLAQVYFLHGAGEIRHMLLIGWGGGSVGHIDENNQRAISHSKKICSLGVFHQDLRPENILWNPDLKRALIIDFRRCTLDHRPIHRRLRSLKRLLSGIKEWEVKRVRAVWVSARHKIVLRHCRPYHNPVEMQAWNGRKPCLCQSRQVLCPSWHSLLSGPLWDYLGKLSHAATSGLVSLSQRVKVNYQGDVNQHVNRSATTRLVNPDPTKPVENTGLQLPACDFHTSQL